MKPFLLVALTMLSIESYAQSITPSIITKRVSGLTPAGKTKWEFIPSRQGDNALAKFYDSDNASTLAGLSVASIRPGLDGSKTNSVYVELLSVIPENWFRLSVGTNIAQSALKDSTRSQEEIALQKLTNGGGNLSLNLNRPLLFKGIGKGFLLGTIDLTGYADIEQFNQSIYNPGWGMQINPSLDFRLINQDGGKKFRFGLMTRYQYNLFNDKYKASNSIDEDFKNLGIYSAGIYLGLAMFNIQVNYNAYNKNTEFFKDKTWLLRVELIPVKF
ncbi:MAG: hypothetical protein BGO21_26325 [Dyadobacter sp. 50-39]|uniref:hypothetical protein n=1 Tax=Dyadobacter sp. 50-39 TaxID=1895756 RepID=UPI00095C4A2E|nr:hypothetical protein [Dyadobacter sp. 50-39]OJV16416.1 MAG: hypothetical protein BGO21_26325 [Dyadobacter sp. 50-39]